MIRRALFYSFTQKFSGLLIRIPMTAVLARLLSPEDYGVFALAMSIIGVAMIISDYGAGVYIIQRKELSRDALRNAFGLTLAVSWACALLLFALSGVIADASDMPRAADIMPFLCLYIMLLPFTHTAFAILKREMDFKHTMRINVLGEVGLAASAIAMAYAGFGVYSLAVPYAIGEAVKLALLAAFVRRALPPLPAWRGWGEIWKFGTLSTLTGAINHIGNVAVNFLIGKYLGPAPLGLYNRAGILTDYVNKLLLNPIKPVALSALSQHTREGHAIREPYLHKLSYFAAIAWPGMVLLIAQAPSIVQLLLGSQWDAVVPVFQILCLNVFFMPFTSLNYEFYVAIGRLPAYLRQEAATHGVRVAAVAVAVFHGLEWVAAAIVLGRITGLVMTWAQLTRSQGIGWRDTARTSLKPFIIMVCTAIPSAVFAYLVATGALHHSLPAMLIVIALSAPFWFAGLHLTRHPLKDEWRHLVKRKKKNA